MPATAARPDAATAHYQATYHGRPDQVSRVRAAVAAHLGDCPVTADAVLIVSEIATNAVRHSGSAGEFFSVRVYRHQGRVWIGCEDLGGQWQCQSDEERPHGNPMTVREHDVSGLTAGELERARRHLQVSLSLARPGSPGRETVLAQMSAIDRELGERTTNGGIRLREALAPAGGRLPVRRP